LSKHNKAQILTNYYLTHNWEAEITKCV